MNTRSRSGGIGAAVPLLLAAALLRAVLPGMGTAAEPQAPAPLPLPKSAAAKDSAAPKADTAKDDTKDGKKEAKKEEPAAPDGKCDKCGGCVCVRKVCVPKPKEKEISKICWSYKCEEFCVPGRSEYCGKKCGKDECGCWSYDVWKPTCAEVRTKNVPVKTEVKRKVPSYEWKLEERCSACRHKPHSEQACDCSRSHH